MTTQYPPRAAVVPFGPPPTPTWNRGITQRVHGRVARWVVAGSTAVGCASLAGYLYFVDPNNPSNAYPKCPLKALTGLDCPGCGGLRATHSLVHGDIAGVVGHNVLTLVIVPLIAYLITRWVLGLFGKELPQLRLPDWSRYLIPIGVLAFTILRNIPQTPFYFFNSGSV